MFSKLRIVAIHRVYVFCHDLAQDYFVEECKMYSSLVIAIVRASIKQMIETKYVLKLGVTLFKILCKRRLTIAYFQTSVRFNICLRDFEMI